MTNRTEPVIPSAKEAHLAREVSRVLEGHEDDHALRLLVDKKQFELPPAALDLLMEILKHMAEGRAVSITSMKAEISTQQAAELLNVSRPYVVGLVDNGTLPHRMVGNQRRLPLADVLAYKAETSARKRSALEALAAHDQELSLR